MKVIGHRGAPTEALENSLESFQKAIQAGASMVELDTWCAKDGTFWISHDDSLKKSCAREERISSLTEKELKTFKLVNGENLPSLGFCLEKLAPFLVVNVELKDKTKEKAKKFFDFLSPTSYKDRLVISCFHLAPLETLELLNDKMQLALLWEENNSYKENPLLYLQEHKKWFFHPQADILTYEMLSKLHAEERVIYPWVSRLGVEDKNREKFWEVMYAMNVHGLCTNYPREFFTWLKNKRG